MRALLAQPGSIKELKGLEPGRIIGGVQLDSMTGSSKQLQDRSASEKAHVLLF